MEMNFKWVSPGPTKLKNFTDIGTVLEKLRATSGKETYTGCGPIAEVKMIDESVTPAVSVSGSVPAFEVETDKKLVKTGKNKISPILKEMLKRQAEISKVEFDFESYKANEITKANADLAALETAYNASIAAVDGNASLTANQKRSQKRTLTTTYDHDKSELEAKLVKAKNLKKSDIATKLENDKATLESEICIFENTNINLADPAAKANCMKYLDNCKKLAIVKEQLKRYSKKYGTSEKPKNTSKLKKFLLYLTAVVTLAAGGHGIAKLVKNGGAKPNQTVSMQTPKSTPYVNYGTPTQAPYINYGTPTQAPYVNYGSYTYDDIAQTANSYGYAARQEEIEAIYFLLNPNEFTGLSNDDCFMQAVNADELLKCLIKNNDTTLLSEDAKQAIAYNRELEVLSDVNMYDMMYLIRREEIEMKRMVEQGLMTSEEMQRQIQSLELQKTVEFSKRLPRTTSQEKSYVKTLG